MQWRIAAVLPHLRGRVLDVGCGTNELLLRYRRDSEQPGAIDSVGIDVFDWPGADLLVEDSSDLPYNDASFDTVAFVASLNHIPNRQEVLRECRRLIRPGGMVIVTMLPPRLSWAWHQVRRPWDADQIERGMQPGEVYGLTRADVDELLTDAGFQPAEHRRFMCQVNLLTLATAAVPASRRARTIRQPALEHVNGVDVLPQPVAARVVDRPMAPASALGDS